MKKTGTFIKNGVNHSFDNFLLNMNGLLDKLKNPVKEIETHDKCKYCRNLIPTEFEKWCAIRASVGGMGVVLTWVACWREMCGGMPVWVAC